MAAFGRSRRERTDVPDGRPPEGSSRTEDLYRTDLDRHLWSLRSEGPPRRSRRRLKRWVASVAGMLGAAGLSYWAYRRLRRTASDPAADRPEPPDRADGSAADGEGEGAV